MENIETRRYNINNKIHSLIAGFDFNGYFDNTVAYPVEQESSVFKDPRLSGEIMQMQMYNKVPDELYLAAAEMLIYIHNFEDLAWKQSQIYRMANA